jgi:hypothetical protein
MSFLNGLLAISISVGRRYGHHERGAARIFDFRPPVKSGALCTISIDLEKVRNGTFRPDFIWHGRSHKPRELIAWVTEIFQVVAARTGIPFVYVFSRDSGRTETWLFGPGERPRRIARKDEPSQNPVSAFVLALTGLVATDSDRRVSA